MEVKTRDFEILPMIMQHIVLNVHIINMGKVSKDYDVNNTCLLKVLAGCLISITDAFINHCFTKYMLH